MTPDQFRTAIDQFTRTSGYDIAGYLNDVRTFAEQNWQTLVDYYSGKTNFVDFQTTNSLRDLAIRKSQVESISIVKSPSLLMWDLYAIIDQANDVVTQALNLAKWLRSTVSNIATSSVSEDTYITTFGQTLEDVSKDVEGKQQYQDQWIEIAIRNDASEESYSTDGGNSFKVDLTSAFGSTVNISAVAGVITGKEIYGRDVARSLSFESDDIVCLSPLDTIYQTVSILSQLKRGDNPGAVNHGLQSGVVGSTINDFNYQVVLRQLSQNFAADDTLKDLTLKSMNLYQDNYTWTFTVSTRLDEIVDVRVII